MLSKRRSARWLGSKWHLAAALGPQLLKQLAPDGRIVSLFYGSGALEQSVPGSRVIAAEANEDLVAFHTQVGLDPLRLVRATLFLDESSKRRQDPEGAYKRVIALQPRTPLERAIRFVWLNRFSRGGMFRVNSAGRFNVPPDRERLASPARVSLLSVLQTASAAVRGTTFVSSWQAALAHARPGDLVMADPPYFGGFVEYTAKRFGAADQVELAAALLRAGEREITVLAFNSIAALRWYGRPWKLYAAPRSGRMNSRAERRQPVDEIVATLNWNPTAPLPFRPLALSPTTPALPEERTAPCSLVASAS